MTDPQRLLESTDDPLIRELLSAARGEQPGDDTLQRTLLAVGVGMAAGASSATAGAAVAAKVGVNVGTKAALGSAAGSAVGKGTVALGGGALGAKLLAAGAAGSLLTWGVVTQLSNSAVGVVTEVAVTAPAHSMAKVPAAPQAARLPQAEPVPDVAPEQQVEPFQGRASERVVKGDQDPSFVGKGPNSDAAKEPSELEQEVALIDAARAAVVRGDTVNATRALKEYTRRFPRGGLAPEAMYLRMQTKLVAGDTEGAKESARQLLQQHPAGPHSAKARAVLEQETKP